MNRAKINKFLCVLLSLTAFKALAFENLVYTWRGFPTEITQGTLVINDLKAHASQIDILSSQAYHIDENGVLYGSVNPQMTQIAKAHHIKLLPLVGNTSFDRAKAHIFLNNPSAQTRAIQSILELCKQNQYDGVQIDFEGLSFLDRDAFTGFYQKVAQALHQNHLLASIAIIPVLTEETPPTDYLKSRYEHFTGAYDYKAIGASSDLVTLMAYDQHGSITPPGPMAGITWVEAIVQIALKYIPPEKISLGLPWHSGYWYTGKDSDSNATASNFIHAVQTDLTYADMMRILKDRNASLRWDDEDKVHYAMYKHNLLYEYIFAEDVDSFKAKLALVKKYQLRGISNWVLGEEDPKVWDVLVK